MNFSEEFINHLKDRVSLSEIIAKHLKLISAGNMRYKALCPFHNEKTPSFVISDDRGSYHCFGCSAHGDVISFLEEREGYSFVEAVEYLANYAGIPIPKDKVSNENYQKNQQELDIINNFNDFFMSNLAKADIAQKYLQKRNLPEEIRQKFQLGYAGGKNEVGEFVKRYNLTLKQLIDLGLYREGQNGSYFLFNQRLMFPIHNHSGKIIAFGGRILGEGQPKYLNSPEHKFFKKREILYNLYNAKRSIQKLRQVIVCEGYMDVLVMNQYGFENTVATLGTAFAETHLQILWNYVDEPIICLDGDVAGQRAMQRIADIAVPLLKAGKSLNFVILPEGQDPDDLLQETGGKEKLQKMVADPIPLGKILLNRFCHNGLKTPEQKAAAQSELRKMAYQIEDKNLQKQYLQYFADGFFSFFRKGNYKTQLKTGNNLAIKKLEFSIEEMNIILFIINNPESLKDEQIDEQFSLMDFENGQIKKIQEYILGEEFVMAKFQLWLSKDIEGQIKAYIAKRLLLDANIEKDSEEDLSAKWQYLYKAYNLAILQKEYKRHIQSSEDNAHKLALDLKEDISKLEAEISNILTT